MSTRHGTAPRTARAGVRTRRIARVGPAIGLAALAGALTTLGACADRAATSPTEPAAPALPLTPVAPSAAPQGNLSVLITDDPFPFDSVARADIYVVRIDARRAEPDSATAERGKDDDHKPGESEHEGEHHGGSGSGNSGGSGSSSSGSGSSGSDHSGSGSSGSGSSGSGSSGSGSSGSNGSGSSNTGGSGSNGSGSGSSSNSGGSGSSGSGNSSHSGSGESGSGSDSSHHGGSGGTSDTSHHGGTHPSRGTTWGGLSFSRSAGPRRSDSPAASADSSDEWVTIAAPKARLNLLDLQGGKTAALGQQGLPVGTYRGFRIVIDVDSSSVTLKSGVVLTAASRPGIRFPSAGRTGIKVNLDHPVTVADTGARMVFDFDLGRSFVLNGTSPGANGFEFKPVVRATLPGLTGALTGTVRDSASAGAVRGATVELLQAGTAASDTTREHVVATAAAGERGAYTAAFLPPGRYALRVTGRSSRSARATAYVQEVEVRAGAEAGRRDVTLP